VTYEYMCMEQGWNDNARRKLK